MKTSKTRALDRLRDDADAAAYDIAHGLARVVAFRNGGPGSPYFDEAAERLRDGIREALILLARGER